MKTCPRCRETKPLTLEFFGTRGEGKPLQSYCRNCMNTLRKSPEAYRRSNLRRNFGITPEQFDERLAQQGGVCAICGLVKHTYDKNGKPRSMHVDHDHQSGRIRGILCHDCNTGIGKLGDSVELLRSAVEYLERAPS